MLKNVNSSGAGLYNLLGCYLCVAARHQTNPLGSPRK